MGDDDRERIRMTGAHVDEVNVDAVDGRYELRECIELCLELPPIVIGAPIADEFLQLRELRALRLIRLLVGPAGRSKTPAKIDDLFFRNVDLEGSDCRVVLRRCKARRQNAESTRGGGGGENAAPGQ